MATHQSKKILARSQRVPRHVLIICLLTLSLISPLGAQLLITNTTVVDVENKKLLPSRDVWIQNGIIKAIGKKIKTPAGAQVLDGSGKYLVPGFVDTHVHFFQSGGVYTRPDVVDLRKFKPYAEEIAWTHQHMENILRRYSRAGITTVVDPGSTNNFLLHRDSFRLKDYAPTIYMTGPLQVPVEFSEYDGLENDGPFYFMKTEEDARKNVRRELPYEPDFIKIAYVVPGRNKDSVARSYLPLVKAAINESHKAGLRVAVHAFERLTAQLAVEAGANHLVHIPFDGTVGPEFIQLLKDKKVVVSSSTTVFEGYRKTFGQYYRLTRYDSLYAHPVPIQSILHFGELPDTALIKSLKKSTLSSAQIGKRHDSTLLVNLKILADAGVTVATATDAGNIGSPHVSSYFRELSSMRAGGLDMWQLLQSSTINGARAVGKEKEFGSITKGKRADLVLLSRNPIDNLDHWQQVDWVILRGVAQKPADLLKSPSD
jgi:imidazolonepropionase-like amidohydrolase